MIAEPLEKGLAEDIENEVVQITWNRCAGFQGSLKLPVLVLSVRRAFGEELRG